MSSSVDSVDSADESVSSDFSLVSGIILNEQLVKELEPAIEIEDSFLDEDIPPAKHPRKEFSPELCLDDSISLPDPFSPSSESCICSPVETDATESVCSVSTAKSISSIQDILLEEPFNFEGDDAFDITNYDSRLLYPSANISVMQSLGILFNWFSSYPGISKRAFSRLLFLLNKFLLPLNNELPSSYTEAKRLMQKLIVPVEEYDSCVNDCIIFRKCSSGNFESLTSCPKCNSDRYFPHTSTSRKKYKYIPIGSRLKRMFANKSVSEILQSHLKVCGTDSEEDTISDLHQSEAWISRYADSGPFKGDARGICFSLCTDGVNPFSRERVSYSMWPITLAILNLPASVRNSSSSLLLAGIIPGKSEPHNLDPYIDILVDEILSLQHSRFYDAYRDEYFDLKLDIFMNVLDYPGQNKLFHCVGANAYAGCAYCTHLGTYSEELQKMVYPGNRCFLHEDDILRLDDKNYPTKAKDLSTPPEIKTTEYVDNANKKYCDAVSSRERTRLVQETGCKGVYALRKLPLHDRFWNTPVDPMHLIKNIVVHCINLITGRGDSIKVRKAERHLNRFPSSWTTRSHSDLPPAPFRLSKEDIKLADDRAKRIFVPHGFDWRPREIFSMSNGYKSHEWKQVCCNGVLKFCLRNMLGEKQRLTFFQLCDVIRQICAEDIMVQSIDSLDNDVHRVLSLIERDFPLSLQVVVFHLLHHLPVFIKRFGPVYSFWMFSFERFNSWITRRILNRRYPEASVIETYRLSELANFMELSGQLTHDAVTSDRDSENDSEATFSGNLPATTQLTDEFLDDLQHYYLDRVPEYKELFDQYQEERKRAKAGHHLKSFPSMSQWVPKHCRSLPTRQLEMCRGPSPNGIVMKCYSYKDHHGRTIKLSSAEYDHENSYCRCSYVSTQTPLKVGRIVSLFHHTFVSTDTVFAFVSWFHGPYLDANSGLYFVLCNTQNQAIVPVTSLSKPLVIAYDDDEVDKLWILNLELAS